VYRVSFDPALPVVAASPFNAGEKSFSAGDIVDWRSLGVTEMTLHDWFRAQLVVHPLPAGESQSVATEVSPARPIATPAKPPQRSRAAR